MKNKLVLVLTVVLSVWFIFSNLWLLKIRELPTAVTPPTIITPAVKSNPTPVVEKQGDVLGTEITESNIFNGVNQIRFNLGLKILKRSASLDKVANDKLQDMLTYKYWAHDNPVTGSKFYSWFKNVSYSYIGENLARNFTTVQDTINGWINSPTHYANIIKKEYTDTGIAISGSLVVQEFGGNY